MGSTPKPQKLHGAPMSILGKTMTRQIIPTQPRIRLPAETPETPNSFPTNDAQIITETESPGK